MVSRLIQIQNYKNIGITKDKDKFENFYLNSDIENGGGI